MQDKNSVSDKPHYHHVYESPSEEEERLGTLFNKLDSNGDGRIDAHDLSEGLKRLSLPQVPGYAEVIIIIIIIIIVYVHNIVTWLAIWNLTFYKKITQNYTLFKIKNW